MQNLAIMNDFHGRLQGCRHRRLLIVTYYNDAVVVTKITICVLLLVVNCV